MRQFQLETPANEIHMFLGRLPTARRGVPLFAHPDSAVSGNDVFADDERANKSCVTPRDGNPGWCTFSLSNWGHSAAPGRAYSEHTIRFPAYSTSTTVLVRSRAPTCSSAALKSSRRRAGVTLGTISLRH